MSEVTTHPFSQHNFWTRRLRKGPAKAFETPQELLDAADEYFEWCNSHPLKAQKIFHHKGDITKATEHRMRAFTLSGLCTFVGIDMSTYSRYRRNDEMAEATRIIDEIIYTQKYEGAAADLLNASLVQRDLGLADRQELTGRDGGAIQTENVGEGARKLGAYLDGITKSSGDTGEPSEG